MKHLQEKTALTLFLAASLCAGAMEKTETRIVRDGVPLMDIVIAEGAPEPVAEAAAELRKYIGKITGAVLPVVHKTQRRAIYIGESSYTCSQGLSANAFSEQEYLIRIRSGNVILLGCDESNASHAKLKGHSFNSLKFFQKTGSLYAVNDFLEKFCGVRWYMPTELGEVVPKTRTLTVPGDFELRRKPSVAFRSLFALQNVPASLHVWKYTKANVPPEKILSEKELLEWGRRMKVGGRPYSVNHSNNSFRERFPEKNSWYAYGSMQNGNQLCFSNEEVFRQVVQDARDFFDGKLPEKYAGWSLGDYFAVMPDDTTTWCNCSKCRAQFKPKKTDTDFMNGSASHYVWSFVGRVASEIAKTHPGKKIGCCAYADYRDCPEDLELPPNTVVFLTKNYADFGSRIKERDTWTQIGKWSGKVPEVFLWDYYLFPALHSCDRFPNMSPWLAAEEIAKMKELRIRGGLMCQLDEWYWRSPAMDHLRVYVTMKLLDNWELDAEALTEEYFHQFYGPAKRPMRAYWKKLDELYRRKNRNCTKLSESDGAKADWTVTCPPGEIARLDALLKEAEHLAPADSVYAKRVRLIRNSAQQVIEENSRRVLALLKNPRSITAARVTHPPKLDGTMNDPLWDVAPGAGDWLEAFGDGKAYYDTMAKVLYDNDYLYVGYRCSDDKDYKVTQVCRARGGQVYLDDSVEFFVQVKPNGETRHFAANTLCTLYEAREKTQGIRTETVVSASVAPGCWTLVFRIPLKELTEEKIIPGTEWKVNYCRNRRGLPGFRCEFFNWSGPNGYHNPERFGTLKFQ
ncbi:MAG: DUF4838 domain-containing protein [Victivallales bacterium]